MQVCLKEASIYRQDEDEARLREQAGILVGVG